jgi:hypothetical protein
MEASMPTLCDYIKEYLARPDVVERLKPVEALFVECSKVYGGMFQMAWTIAERATKSCPSIAYEPLLIEHGVKPVPARALASLTIRIGTRQANESRRLPEVIEAIRFLAKPGRRRQAILRRAEVLLAAWEETSIIETIFDESLIEVEFIGSLKSVVEGRAVAWRRLTEIAATIASLLSIPRGPKISAASASHELLLEELVSITGSQGYTWNSYKGEKGDFSDRLTHATRREFGCPRFSPKSARRRLRRRRAPLDRSRREA